MADIEIKLLDSMGDDLRVVNAARVSFDKESEWENWDSWDDEELRLPDGDKKLIRYLAEHDHWSPFAHVMMTFRVKAPIFLARQLQKHTVGFAWNEVSRRYVDSEPEFFKPKEWRGRPTDGAKQGSSDDVVKYECHAPHEIAIEESLRSYKALLFNGVAPEQARMVLPQSMMTEWIWTGSLYGFARVYNLRNDPHAQKDLRPIVEGIRDAGMTVAPVSWEWLTKKKDA